MEDKPIIKGTCVNGTEVWITEILENDSLYSGYRYSESTEGRLKYPMFWNFGPKYPLPISKNGVVGKCILVSTTGIKAWNIEDFEKL